MIIIFLVTTRVARSVNGKCVCWGGRGGCKGGTNGQLSSGFHVVASVWRISE